MNPQHDNPVESVVVTARSDETNVIRAGEQLAEQLGVPLTVSVRDGNPKILCTTIFVYCIPGLEDEDLERQLADLAAELGIYTELSNYGPSSEEEE